MDWYTKEERDRLLEGIFRLEPQWYLFFYLTARLGLRTGEVYALAHRQFRREPPLGHRSEQSTHQYAHLGSGAQRRLVEALKPARAPHEPAPKNGHVNLASTAPRTRLDDGTPLH